MREMTCMTFSLHHMDIMSVQFTSHALTADETRYSAVYSTIAMAVARRVTVLLLCALTVVCAQPMPLCNQSNYTTSPNPPIPSLPRQFSAVIEANYLQSNQSALAREYFDEIGNRGRFEINGILGIFDYNLNEVFLIPDPDTRDGCTVVMASAQSPQMSQFFGFRMVNGSVLIGTVAHFFRLNSNASANYLGQEYVRGIMCDHWQTCTVMGSKSYTLDYYFSTADWTFTANPNGSQIPVQIILNGWTNDGSYINHVYSFVDFVSGPQSVPDEVFMVPTGLACRGRIPGQPLPTLPNSGFFTTYIESVFPARQFASVIREFYDLTHQLVRFDRNDFYSIYDFNNEVLYVIRRQFSNCTVVPITATTPASARFFSDVDESGRPHLRPASDFLLLNQYNYSYEGVTNVRGVDVDSWLSIRDFQQFPNAANLTNGSYEIFFTRPGWRISNTHSVITDPIPWRINVSGTFTYFNRTDNDTISWTGSAVFDLFGGSGDEPNFDVFDTSICFPPSEYRVVTMAIPGQENGLDLRQLRKAVRQSVSTYAQTQPLQVGSIEIIGENGTYIFVTFHIANLTRLASPPPGTTTVTANQAIQRIISNLGPNGTLPFTIALNASMNVTPIYLNVSRRAIPPPCPPVGVPAWEVAVVVILFILVGLVIGVVGTIIVYCLVTCIRKKRSVTMQTATYKKHEDEAEIET